MSIANDLNIKTRMAEGGARTRGVLKESRAGSPLVTIVTVVFNRKEHLEETILSVLSQSYENLEYIIIDGGSTDGTLEIIKRYDDRIDYWVSEKDEGISDAFNKGVALSRGDYINFQGDGDGFLHPDSIKALFQQKGVEVFDLVCGRVRRIAKDGATLYDSPERKFHKRSLLFRMALPHQGLFTHRRFFEKYGFFDSRWKFAMDYELLLRAYHHFPRVFALPEVVAHWRADGIGNNRTREVLREYDLIKRHNRIAPKWVLLLVHVWSVFKLQMRTAIGTRG